jgi:general stress protein 26
MFQYDSPSSTSEVREEIRDLLAKCYFAYLCTVDEENQPHITPIFFAYDDNTNLTYFTSASKSTKIRNIQLNNRVSLTADIRDPINPFKNIGVMIEGEARIEREIDPGESSSSETYANSAQWALERFKRKYAVVRQVEPSFSRSMSLIRRFSEVLVSIRPKKIVYWEGGGRFRRVEF